ncbi:MAG: phosphotransferase, partial [Betaproteobacteria bacterium]
VLTTGDLRDVLEAARLHAPAELGAALQEICGGADGATRILDLRQLKSNVYRVRLDTGDGANVRSLMLKSSNPALARHNQLVARRWLPAIGLTDAGARLEGAAADRQGQRMWLIYEDLGDARLDGAAADRARVGAVVDLIAALHVRSAGHAVLPDARAHGGDLGAPYLCGNVRDAVRGLEQLRPPRVTLTPEQESVRDRLLARLRALQHELPDRLLMLELGGGPEVLLHGDLWTTNAFALAGPRPGDWHARLIDWDHAGVGWSSYDLSTFLLRFPQQERPWILGRYRTAVERAGGEWQLPEGRELNVVLETAEFARFANRAVWPAVELLVDGAPWAFEELAMVAGWFDDWQPVLPEPGERTR